MTENMAETQKDDKKVSVWDKYGISDEDKQLMVGDIRDEVMKSIQVVPPDESPVDSVDVVPAEKEWEFTNVTAGDLIIHDLGVSSPSGTFEPEVFRLGQTKDLSDYYTQRELKKSHAIRRALMSDPPLLVRGKAVGRELNAASKKAKEDPRGTFNDPTSPVGEPGSDDFKAGTGYYDEKLEELRKKDKQEDLRTRKQ